MSPILNSIVDLLPAPRPPFNPTFTLINPSNPTLPLLGALWVHWPNGWLFTNAEGGWEYPAFLAVAAAVQGLLGPGALAIRLPRPKRPVPA